MGWYSAVKLTLFECYHNDMAIVYRQRESNLIRGFTIVELLVVIVVLGILGLITLNTINPGEIYKRSRDTTRAVDLKNINQMLMMYDTADGSSFGLSNIVYISLPDSSATCSSYTLPTLPSGWSYACKDSVNYQNTDGSGWIPVNFETSSTQISKLPTDPVNVASGGLYYSYITGGSWELNAAMEADSNTAGNSNDKTSIDGGDDPTRLEVGNDLALAPWSFEFSSFPLANLNSGLPGWRNYVSAVNFSLGSDSTSANFVTIPGYAWYIWQENIPFNPNSIYKMTCRFRQSVEPTVGGKGAFCGWAGVSSDSIALVNMTGINTHSSQHYHAASGQSLTSDWTQYTGYTKGWGSPNGASSGCANIATPCKMHANVRYIRPLFILNYSVGNGTADIDSILFTKQ